MITKLNKTMIASSIAMALGMSAKVQAIQVIDVLGVGIGVNMYTDSANMTMLNGSGGTVGGTNDVSMVWNGNAYTSSSDYSGPGGPSNITASTTTLFFGQNWTAHDIQVFAPGSYSFDTTLGGGNPEIGTLTGTVPIGSFGVHMLFDWSGNNNIDVFVVAQLNSVFGSGVARSQAGTTYSGANNCDASVVINCLWDGAAQGPAGKPSGSKVWMLASTDANGDGIMGIPMASNGPFQGFNANFNADMSVGEPVLPGVPVPAAVWLLGSGLMGLIGMGRRRR